MNNNKPIGSGFKAIKYRYSADKWDGDRPLAVWHDFKINKGKLYFDTRFDLPLQTKSNQLGRKIKQLLNELNVYDPLNKFVSQTDFEKNIFEQLFNQFIDGF